jgi:hypothetical protein
VKNLKWMPPPGWPLPPEGWAPPPGWTPDPGWPPAPAGWVWWQPTGRGRETVIWVVAALLWSVGWGLPMRLEGPSGRHVGLYFSAYLAGLICAALAGGVLNRRRVWRQTFSHLVWFAIVSGVVLVALIGPDSGAKNACNPGEQCDIESGSGLITAPLFLAAMLLVLAALGRGAALLWGGSHKRHREATRMSVRGNRELS